MREVSTEKIYAAIKEMALHSVCNIDKSTDCLVRQAAATESKASAKFALDTIVKNNEIASRCNMPACQDTGMAVIVMQVGQEVIFSGEYIVDAINRAVREAYEEGYFRKSVLDPLTRQNTKDNTPAIIHTEIVKGDKVILHFLAKGFGSENMSRLFMLTPAAGIEGIKKCVLETVTLAGANPCPPIVVGVGIGGTMEKAALIAKLSLLREPNIPNPREDIAILEAQLKDLINQTGIGAQGFGGDTTALSVNVETFPTHIAGLPVAVNIQCHAVRHGTKII